MKISSLTFYQFSISFKKEFRLKNNFLAKREGLIIKVTSDEGSIGYGEISPLAGFSEETLDEAKHQLFHLRKFVGQTICDDFNAVIPKLFTGFENEKLNASVSFGFESALFQILSLKKNIPFYSLWGKRSLKPIPVIGLLMGEEETLIEETERLLKQGYQHFKLKVGKPDVDEEVKKVKQVVEKIKEKATLRLDANRSWSLKDALNFTKSITSNSIEYFEEPFDAPIEEISNFYNLTKIPVALDESLFAPDINKNQLSKIKGLCAFILKPTLTGGITRTIEWMDLAKNSNIKTVISSCFESSLGLVTLGHLAVMNDCQPCGVDTLKFFENDVLLKSLDSSSGHLKILPNIFDQKNFNTKVLTEIN